MTETLISLDTLAPGFADPVHDAQGVFRVLLDTLARPGSIGWIDTSLDHSGVLSTIPAAALAALLTLSDYTTPVWLQQRNDALASAIRFHTGAALVHAPAQAVFAYATDPAALPLPETFALGEPDTPELAATVLIRVDAFEGGRSLTLTGPGIQTSASIAPVGIADFFWIARAALKPLFPCGIDCYLVCGQAVMGVPRTTHVELN